MGSNFVHYFLYKRAPPAQSFDVQNILPFHVFGSVLQGGNRLTLCCQEVHSDDGYIVNFTHYSDEFTVCQ